jgi:hypothetical protein
MTHAVSRSRGDADETRRIADADAVGDAEFEFKELTAAQPALASSSCVARAPMMPLDDSPYDDLSTVEQE